MSGYIHRKLESKHDCVYCEEYLKNSETKTCDLIEKKKLGALVKPHPDIETIVNVTDCILSQKIKGTMFFGYLIFDCMFKHDGSILDCVVEQTPLE